MEERYHGVDLHSTNFLVNTIVKKNDGSVERNFKKVYLDEIKTKFISHLTKSDYVCLEASTGSFTFAKLLKPHVKDVFVINPFDFKALYLSGRKTDKIDAKKLANKLKYHIEANDPEDGFPSVFIPDDKVTELRGLFSTYELYKKQKNALKNRVHSIIKQNLIHYDSVTLFTHFDTIMPTLKLNERDKKTILLLYEDILHFEARQEQIKEEILSTGYQRFANEIKLIIGIPGISVFIACAILADIGCIQRFKNSKKFCSYLRSAPKIDASNEKIKNGSINKKGRKLSFSFVLQGLIHIIKTNPNFKEFQSKNIVGKNKCKVRSALIRKTFEMLFYMLKNKTEYKYIDNVLHKKKIMELEKFLQKKIGNAA